MQDRWNQIKKNTTPASNPGLSGGQPPAAVATPETAAQFSPRPSSKSKFLVRMLIILLIVGIIGVAAALILSKNESPASGKKNAPSAPAAETAGNGSQNDISQPAETKPEENKQSSPLATISTIPIYTENMTSVPNLLFPYLQSPFDSNGYYRVLIQNKKDNTYAGIRQFFSIFNISAPALFYSAVKDDFTLFIYSNKGKNRLGFVAYVSDASALATAMDGWEGNLAQDTNNLYKFLGRKTQDASVELKFKSAGAENGVQYRFLDFSPAGDDYAIAYAIYNGKYFVFSTSNEALLKSFNQLPK